LAAVAFEPISGEGYLFGGTLNLSQQNATWRNDLWRFEEGVWVAVTTLTSPPALPKPAACAWPGHGMLLASSGQTWLLDGTNWTQITSGIDIAVTYHIAAGSGGVMVRSNSLYFSTDDGLNWSETVLAAWGVDFETKFLRDAFRRIDRVVPFTFKVIDVRSLGHLPRAKLGFTDYMGLGESCDYYGVPFDSGKAHDALYDATKTAELVLALLKLD